MRLNSKVTWGLAWAGLAVVVAVPSADFLTGKMGANTAAMITSTTDPVAPAQPVVTGSAAKTAAVSPTLGTDPVKTAAVTTKVTKTGVSIIPAPAGATGTDPVNKYLQSGKPLPDYISGGSATTAPTTEVAAIDPAAPVVAPVPFPSRPPDVVRPVLPKSTEPAVIVDDSTTAEIDSPDITPIPPAGIPNDNAQSWKRARLDRYLEEQGLLDDSGRSSATVTTNRNSANYDPDGFYLSDGPNSERSRAARRARVEQMFGDQEDAGDDGSFSFDLF